MNRTMRYSRCAGLALAGAVALAACAAETTPVMALHLDFNSIQLKREAVVKTLRDAAAHGYNAILWEIEDKVKWETCPECVHPEAFTKQEFRSILAEAKRLGLAPIPLFQTFGHAEYVLMHGNHPEWMEKKAELASCYCVSKPEVRAFQKRMIHEYLDLFGPDVREFHLGGDEAYAFGTCPVCRKRNRMELYAEHLQAVAAELLEKGIHPGVWCDMILNEKSKAATAKIPRTFTIWFWDYRYNGTNALRWPGFAALRELGFRIFFCPSTNSAGDGPFLPQFGYHRRNVAGSADFSRRERFAGYCVTSWSLRLAPKSIQTPLFDFAAKRFLDPSPKAEADYAAAVKASFGDIAPTTLERLTQWDIALCAFDGRGWAGGLKATLPAPPQHLSNLLGQRFKTPQGRARLAKTVAARRQTVAVALDEIRRTANRGARGERLVEGAELTLAYLDRLGELLAGKPVGELPYLKTERYFAAECPPRAAAESSAIAWSVLAPARLTPAGHVSRSVLAPTQARDIRRRQWEARRDEVRAWFEENFYGRPPVGRPADLTFDAKGFSCAGGRVRVNLKVSVPEGASAEHPAPVFVYVTGNWTKYEIPYEAMAKRGYAVVRFDINDIAPDEPVKSGRHIGGVLKAYGGWDKPAGWGRIGAWAWGVSRIVDWIETRPELDRLRIAVAGHSRCGKTALWASATDARIALAVANGSGTGGAHLNEAYVPDAELVYHFERATSYNFFCPNFRKLAGRETLLAHDADDLIRLTAPRLAYVASGEQDYGAGPFGEFEAARRAGELWRAYALPGLALTAYPPAGTADHTGYVGYHIHAGGHYIAPEDWMRYADFADAHGWNR